LAYAATHGAGTDDEYFFDVHRNTSLVARFLIIVSFGDPPHPIKLYIETFAKRLLEPISKIRLVVQGKARNGEKAEHTRSM
jgi:hypothetical protein